ncbi:YfcC family protein [Ferrimonas senticii]|uniref:YfcC family protein n=1 Tax=Ferrimonas senticii TaxID=394566 RepID=UPI00041EE061|nr:YfcC family protein [Ferrimonas senticii]
MKAISRFKLPSAYTILFIIIAFMAAMTWVVPAGQYEMVMNEDLGREIAVAGTYAATEANPQGFLDIISAPIIGIQKTIDLGLFILFIGGYLMVITATGAIDSGIARAVVKLKGKEHLMIPALMLCFAAGGTIYGMAEETIPFYILLLPVMIAAGYDAVTAVAIVLIGSGIGVLGSTINPFATVIASDASGIPFTEGMMLRLVILVLSFVTACAFVMRYAAKVRQNPELSVVADLKQQNEQHFLHQKDAQTLEFTGRHKIILTIFGATFAIMVWGVAYGGWWMNEMSMLFLLASILVALIGGLSEEQFAEKFVDGTRDLLGVMLVLGIARGIGIIMDNGMISGTILHWGETVLADVNSVLFVNLMYGIHIILSFLIPSTSGLAVFSMPIIAPLADFAGVGRDLAVTAYQSASGWVNLITPTSGVVIAALAIGRISIVRWIKFIAPLLLALAVISMVCLSLAAL